MPIYYIDEVRPNFVAKRKLPNGVFRYGISYHNVYVAIDSKRDMTDDEIYSLLDKFSVNYLVDREGTIIIIK